MKVLLTIGLIFLYSATVFSVSGYAQGDKIVYKQSIAEKAFEIFPASLESNIPGIVESTIYNIIILKKFFPVKDYSKFVGRLNEIAEKHSDPSIRFKAHLASIYLNFSETIDVQPVRHTYDHEYIFKQITEQLENELFVIN